MSLYNMVVGTDPACGMVLGVLGFTKDNLDQIPRLRDAYVDVSGESLRLVILTRTGGNNRDDYAEQNTAMTKLAGYVDDYDDSFDSTFAHWRYEVPEQYKDFVAEFVAVGKEEGWKFPTPMARFREAVEGLNRKDN